MATREISPVEQGWNLASSVSEDMKRSGIIGAQALAATMNKRLHFMTITEKATTVIGGRNIIINNSMGAVETEVTIYHELGHHLLFEQRVRLPNPQELEADEVICETFGNLMLTLGEG